MERVCGIIARSVTSRLHPYGTLNQIIKRAAQLQQIKLRYGLVDSLDFTRQDEDEGPLSATEYTYAKCKSRVYTHAELALMRFAALPSQTRSASFALHSKRTL